MAPNRTLEDFHAGSRDRQSKGGVGKTTLATNLAGYFARHGHAVMLGDTDRQQSSRAWLNLRPESAPPISTWDIDADNIARPPKGTTRGAGHARRPAWLALRRCHETGAPRGGSAAAVHVRHPGHAGLPGQAGR
jgi:hypothetical protein